MRWFLFLLTAVAIYAAMHLLVLWGLHPLFAGRPRLPLLVLAWMGSMVLAPLAVPLLERGGLEFAARGLAWVSYSWLGLLFLAFSLCAVLGAWELLAWLAAAGLPSLPGLSLHGPSAAAGVLLLSVGAALYGCWEARQLQVERVTLVSPKLPPGRERLRIALVSDLHLGLLHREGFLAAVLVRLRELNPDLLLAAGDVLDAQVDHLDGLSDLWRGLAPPLGKFAVVGNHEVYAGLAQSLAFLRRGGFTVLRNEAREVAGVLTLVGVDDPHRNGAAVDEATLLQDQAEDRFTVLIKHRPSLAPRATGRFDLQLSGHTHRGQIFPFCFLTGLQYPRQDGLYPLAGGGHLYVSRGTGTWGPPLRVLAPPEITLIEVVREPA